MKHHTSRSVHKQTPVTALMTCAPRPQCDSEITTRRQTQHTNHVMAGQPPTRWASINPLTAAVAYIRVLIFY